MFWLVYARTSETYFPCFQSSSIAKTVIFFSLYFVRYRMLSQKNYRECLAEGWSNDIPHCEGKEKLTFHSLWNWLFISLILSRTCLWSHYSLWHFCCLFWLLWLLMLWITTQEYSLIKLLILICTDVRMSKFKLYSSETHTIPTQLF